jgi:hypothetical protein
MTEPENIDYTAMTSSDLLQALGDDAGKWAAAFVQHAAKLGYLSIDEFWMIGWFSNAIEHSSDVRHRRGQPETRPVYSDFP